MLIFVIRSTKVYKKIRMEKKRDPFNYGLTLVNGGYLRKLFAEAI
jgi:hypothetical protein